MKYYVIVEKASQLISEVGEYPPNLENFNFSEQLLLFSEHEIHQTTHYYANNELHVKPPKPKPNAKWDAGQHTWTVEEDPVILAANLARMKEVQLKSLNELTDKARAELYPSGPSVKYAYDLKVAEAKAYPESEPMLLLEEAELKDIPVSKLVEQVLEASERATYRLSVLELNRIRYNLQLVEATTEEEATAVYEAAVQVIVND